MNLARLLAQAARMYPTRTAVAVGIRPHLDYRELDASARSLGHALADRLNVGRGARVAIVAENHPDYLTAMWGAWYAGCCVVPINAKLHPKELAFIFDNCGPSAAFVSPSTAEGVGRAIADAGLALPIVELGSSDFRAICRDEPARVTDCASDEPAWIFYTSGTTGRPKGATLTHGNLLGATLRYYADVDFVGDGESMLHLAPLSHGSGLYSLPLIAKGATQIVADSGGFDADEAFDLLGAHRRVTTFLAPTMLMRLVNHPRAATAPADHWRTIFYGGAPMYVENLKAALSRFGPCFWQGYGQGESPCTITSLTKAMHADATHPDYERRLTSAGVARTGVEVRVVDGDDRELPTGELGEVVVRSDVTMTGYWRDPEATRESLRGGWLHTGDIGEMSGDGFLTLRDRSKDLIISGGSNIYPREIEEVLLRDDRLLEVSVVGAPHDDWGEVPVAFVVTKPGREVDAADLDALCLSQIARFKRPKQYLFLDALPKSHYGKVLKTELRKRLTESNNGRA